MKTNFPIYLPQCEVSTKKNNIKSQSFSRESCHWSPLLLDIYFNSYLVFIHMLLIEYIEPSSYDLMHYIIV